MSMIPHKITPFQISVNDGVLEYSSKTAPNLYHIWVQDACLQVYARGGALFEGCLLLENPIFENIQNNT